MSPIRPRRPIPARIGSGRGGRDGAADCPPAAGIPGTFAQAPGFSHPISSPELPGFPPTNPPRLPGRGRPALYLRLPICVPPHANPPEASPRNVPRRTETSRQLYARSRGAQLRSCTDRSCAAATFSNSGGSRAAGHIARPHPRAAGHKSACGRAQPGGGSPCRRARRPRAVRARFAPRRGTKKVAAHRVARPSALRVTWKSNLRNNHTTRRPRRRNRRGRSCGRCENVDTGRTGREP